MGWKRRTGGIAKWAKDMLVEGIYEGQKEGKFGTLLLIREDGENPKAYAQPAQLASIFAEIKPGTLVRVLCRGKDKLPDGKEAWGFEVDESVDEDEDLRALTE